MKKDPLDAVRMLAEISELEKSREVADSIVHLSAARERLALLEQYMAEYETSAGGTSTDIERLRSQRSFIGALAQAIGDQSHSVTQTQVALEQRIETWRSARANTKAVSKLAHKREQVQRRHEQRHEQAELDAAGQRKKL